MGRTLAVLLGVTLLLPSASSAAGAGEQKPPRYKTYVVCSAKKSAPAATECGKGKPTTAIFLSKDQDATYKICVKFPGRPKKLCATDQHAEQGVKSGNTITTNKPGEHKVTWYVGGEKVGAWSLDIHG